MKMNITHVCGECPVLFVVVFFSSICQILLYLWWAVAIFFKPELLLLKVPCITTEGHINYCLISV